MARTARARIFAGNELKDMRAQKGLGQGAMAARLGLSVSYLSQLESNDRPLTVAVMEAIFHAFPLDWQRFDADRAATRLAEMREAITDPLFDDAPPSAEALHRSVEQQPLLADRFLRLHAAYRKAEQRLQIVDDAIASGVPGGGRLPWEDVRDWFHEAGNYIDTIDRQAEALAAEIEDSEAAIVDRLQQRHGLHVVLAASDAAEVPLRAFDRTTGRLTIDRTLPTASRRFLLAHQLAALELAEPIAAVADSAELRTPEAYRLLSVGLANYAAGALLMPYGRFRVTAQALRHDIDRLGQRFGVSFEQACHRLSTLQRPGQRGIPFFFCRVDMAGNITKRHSATRLQFARFGGACPLWIVHEAVAIPDRILVQLAETPDGVRYISMAKGLVKPSGSYTRMPRRYAVALGCEVDHAREFVYADGLDVANRAATPIGISCRLCSRQDCDQRAFPPADRPISVDPDVRNVVPYRVL
jgi:predicted transcriptional regulator/DNA-binding XRE family transcriptional regulator